MGLLNLRYNPVPRRHLLKFKGAIRLRDIRQDRVLFRKFRFIREEQANQRTAKRRFLFIDFQSLDGAVKDPPERKKIKNKNTFDFLKEESVMAKTKIAVLWGLLIAMMVACAGIYAALKAREMNPYMGSTGTYVETVQPNGEASAVVADNVVAVND